MIDLFSFEAYQRSQTLTRLAVHVIDSGILGSLAAEHPEDADLASVLIRDGLENNRHAITIDVALELELIALPVDGGNGPGGLGIRKATGDRVQNLVGANVVGTVSRENWDQYARRDCRLEALSRLLLREFTRLEVLFHQGFI